MLMQTQTPIPPEIPVVPDPNREIIPTPRHEPEIPPPSPDPITPSPQTPEIDPSPALPEIPLVPPQL